MTSAIGYTHGERIVIRGHDLAEDLMGQADYVDMMILTSLDRFPSPSEKAILNAIMVSLMDHGLTPSTLAARLTYLGAPEAFQAAVAAGLLGAGSTFLGGMQEVATLLLDAGAQLPPEPSDAEVDAAAQRLVAARIEAGLRVPGLGHNVHTDRDPRVDRLRAIVTEHGHLDRHWRLMDALPGALAALGKRSLPMNNVGAVGATIAALGYPPQMGRGIALAARAGGLIAHLLEEMRDPLAMQIWEQSLASMQVQP